MQNPVGFKSLQRGEYWFHDAMQTAITNKMESKKSETNQSCDVQVPPTDEGQRTNIMHKAKAGHKNKMKPDVCKHTL